MSDRASSGASGWWLYSTEFRLTRPGLAAARVDVAIMMPRITAAGQVRLLSVIQWNYVPVSASVSRYGAGKTMLGL
jgi:hypothetical protein